MDKSLFELFYASKDWKSAPFQRQVFSAISKGKNGLLNVPTGFGKTNALLVPIVLDGLVKISKKTKIFAIWISPLRALSKEIENSAREVTDYYNAQWKVASRNGDTPSSERQKLNRKPPQILVTTPESLHLMMAQKKYEQTFADLEYFVVDEWHELVGSKRAVLVELALSRLKNLSSQMKIWGISATIGNLEQVEEVLFGYTAHAQNYVRVNTRRKKKVKIKSILPKEAEEYPWAGHLGIKMAHKVVPVIEKYGSTLLFTNTRNQAEFWYQTLMDIAPQFAGQMALHHSSINRETRDWVENALHEGRLKVVVCTASLDLGVDFRPVECVIQVGGPKGVARFLQRAGRSGHRPDEVSEIYFMPTHSIELLEASALREATKQGKIESRQPYVRSFDVLAQYMVTLAISSGFRPDKVLREVKTTHCFASISDEEYSWLLTYITKGGNALKAYDEFQKVEIEDGLYKVTNRRIAMRHRLSIGTIVGNTALRVKLMKGGYLGTIEEYFITKLKEGDNFWFAGRNLEFIKVKGNQALVKPSNKKNGKVPAWGGGRMPLSSMLGAGLREQLTHVVNENYYSRELKSLLPTLNRQRELSAIPTENQLLLENFETREGHHLVVYPFEGRFVHEAIGSLLAYRISLLQPISFSIAINDYGFELLSDQPIPIQDILDNNLLSPVDLKNDLAKSINATEMARKQFRDIATICGLVFTGYPGNYKEERHLKTNSQLFFNVFREYDPNNLFLQQAYEEAYYHQLEESRLREVLHRIQEMEILISYPEKATPFAFPIMIDRLRTKISSEKLEDRIKKMQVQFSR